MEPSSSATTVWSNWVGNQSFPVSRLAHPATEAEAVETLRAAAATGESVRVLGAGHSFSPIIETEGLVVSQRDLRGVVSCDRGARLATARAGTLLAEFGPALWEQGLALANQGDIDSQTIAGAVATGTHGSGVELGSFSASVVDGRLITPAGTVVRLTDDADLLRAARVSIGTLGMLIELTLSVTDAYHLDERIVAMTVDEVLEGWERLKRAHRHFSFFWLPTPQSAALYGLEADVGGDVCLVKIHDLTPDPATAEDGHRVDRAYRIYPSVMEANFDELEYMVPIEHGRQAFLEIRELVQERFSDCTFPVEVRFTKADDGMLSPNFAGDTAAISVSGHHGTDYWDFLRAADEILDRLDGRPHWGKLHFLTRERVDRLYPEAERFRELRRELDPDGRFLNDSLRELLG